MSSVPHTDVVMTAVKPKRCTVKKGRFVEPCWALRSVLNPSYSKAAGLAHRHLVNVETCKPSRSFVVLRFNKNDIVLNHCPFCGAKINAPMKD